MIENQNIINDIIENVKDNITKNNLICNNDRIIVAVSGGPDSVTLLDILYKLKDILKIDYEIIVAHVNHMIREESYSEKEYVENLCKKYNVEFNYLEVDIKKIAKELKISEEMAGREKRYEFFNSLLKEKKANKIAVAHNLDDNVETILLNLIRGTGLKGLRGMKYKNNTIIRPLLNVKKCDILLYAEINKLNPCFDKTNNESIYLRNKIRNILIPTLKDEYNSNIVQNIIRMSKIVSCDDDFIEQYTDKIFNESIVSRDSNSITFNYLKLLNEHLSIKNRFILKLLDSLGMYNGTQSVNIEDILELLTKNIKGKKYIKSGKFQIIILKKNLAKIFVEEEI